MSDILSFRDISFSYEDGHEALSKISFSVCSGESVALIGSNGAGKSTLLLHSNGTNFATSGEVFVHGKLVTPKQVADARRAVGIVFQNPDDQLFMPTVGEDVAFGPTNMGLSRADVEARTVKALAAVDALSLRERFSHKLSGGEKRRVALATVIAMDPSILVFDEPSAHLDPFSRRRFIELLKTLPQAKIIATHDLDLAWDLCERTVVLHSGKVVFDGKSHEIFSSADKLHSWNLELPMRFQMCPACGR